MDSSFLIFLPTLTCNASLANSHEINSKEPQESEGLFPLISPYLLLYPLRPAPNTDRHFSIFSYFYLAH